MQVELISVTPNALDLIVTAARRCYSPNEKIVLPKGEDEKADFLEKVLKRGHTSILEHVTFSFHITGISRVTSHQLVRHRVASYAQQSLRYTKATEPAVVTPASIKENEQARVTYRRTVRAVYEAYHAMLDAGIKPEDARYILPMGIKTNIIVTMNARELYETFLPLRMCYCAQWEVRDLAYKMYALCLKELAFVFQFTGSQCKIKGYCPEKNPNCPIYNATYKEEQNHD